MDWLQKNAVKWRFVMSRVMANLHTTQHAPDYIDSKPILDTWVEQVKSHLYEKGCGGSISTFTWRIFFCLDTLYISLM